MSFDFNPSDVVVFLRGAVPNTDFYVSRRGIGFEFLWVAGDPTPTEQEIIDAAADLTTVNGQTFSQWHAENGSDPVLTLHRKAREALDAQGDINVLTRAALIEIIEYAVSIAEEHNALLAWLGAQTTLVNRPELNDFASPTPSIAQARNAIKTRIDAGEADD